MELLEQSGHYHDVFFCRSATVLGSITVRPDADLESVRRAINQLLEQPQGSPTGTATDDAAEKPDWCFVDCEHLFSLYPLRSLSSLFTSVPNPRS